MSRRYQDPVVVTHRGRPISLARWFDDESDTSGIAYDVLDLRVDSEHDDRDWTGWQDLPSPPGLAPAGMSLLMTQRRQASHGLLGAVSDQTSLFVFTGDARTVYCRRYLVVDNPDPGATTARVVLQVAWQVRYQRSASPDVPASPADSLGAVAPDGQPFLGPVVQLPLSTGRANADIDLAGGNFWVGLVPTGTGDTHRWQVLARDVTTDRLYAWSLARGDDGMPIVAPDQVDEATSGLRPDASIRLQLARGDDDVDVSFDGPPDAVLYLKQEPVTTEDGTVLRMSQVHRVLVTVPVVVDGGDVVGDGRGLATLDFAVDVAGRLALLGDGTSTVERTLTAGLVGPAEYSLAFDGRAEVVLPTDGGYVPGKEFTLEAWVHPTVVDADDHGIIGAPGEDRPPSVWLTSGRRLAVGFSWDDGEETAFVSATSGLDVVEVNAWNHVAFTYDQDGPRLYHNGRDVPLVDPFDGGLEPLPVPITRLGAGRGTFVGLMDEVRAWSVALDATALRRHLYHEIPTADAVADPDLQAYWRLDEGTGTTAADVAGKGMEGAGYDGALSGPQWQARPAPVRPDRSPLAWFDPQGLSVDVGVILPDDEHPMFGALADGTRTSLLSGSDGLLHCYAQAPDGDATVAQFDTAITRANHVAGWTAGPVGGAGTEQGLLRFVARQSGSVGNIAVVVVDQDPVEPGLVEVVVAEAPHEAELATAAREARRGREVRSGWVQAQPPTAASVGRQAAAGASLGVVTVSETWRGLPPQVDALANILDGLAVGDPTDPRARSGEATYYDYAGTRPMAFLSASGAPDPTGLRFVSRLVGPFACRGITIEPDPDGVVDRCAVLVHTASDADHDRERLRRTITNVPRSLRGFRAVLDGTADSLDDQAPSPGDTRVWVLATEAPAAPDLGTLQVYVPPPVEAARITVSPAESTRKDQCNLSIRLTVDGSSVDGKWVDVERKTGAVVAAVRADPQDVGTRLRFQPPPAEGLVVDQQAQEATARAFVSSVELFVDGSVDEVDDAELDLRPRQGASSTDETADLARGSHLFRVVAGPGPGNGYPPLVERSDAPLPLGGPGLDGGWLAESPRQAVATHDGNGLVVDTQADPTVFTSPQELTLEAWCRPALPGKDAAPSPRLVHANPLDDGDQARYMVGLRSTVALLVVNDVGVGTTDIAVTTPARRLAEGPTTTIQLWVRPDLTSTTLTNRVWMLTFNGVGAEALDLTPDGRLLLRWIPAGEDSTIVAESAPGTVASDRWQLLTVVHDGDAATVFVDGTVVATGTRGVISATGHALQVGGNTRAPELQVRLNGVAVWNAARIREDIERDRSRSIPVGDPGLVLLWPLDDRDDHDRVRNIAMETVGHYDTVVTGRGAIWPTGGVFSRAFGSVRSAAVQSRDALVAPDSWHHLGVVYRPRYGLAVSQAAWADCGDDGSLDVENGLTIGGWLAPDRAATGSSQVALGKVGVDEDDRSYQLGLTGEGCPTLVVRVVGQLTPRGSPVPERDRLHTFTAPDPVGDRNPVQVTGTVELAEVVDAATGRLTFSVSGQVYVDGVPTLPGPALPEPSDGSTVTWRLDVIGGSGSGRYAAGTSVVVTVSDVERFTSWIADVAGVFGDTASMQSATIVMPDGHVTASAVSTADRLAVSRSSAPLTIGRIRTGSDGAGEVFTGIVADPQLWERALSPSDVARSVATGTLADERDGLVSAWRCNEQEGLVAHDLQLDNNAVLTSSTAWAVLHTDAGLDLLVDGRPVPVTRESPGAYGGYAGAQFRLGDMLDEFGGRANGFAGDLDEIRIWRGVRTREQLRDSMHTYLTGREPDLLGYWRFDVGSGTTVVDRTAWGHDAEFDPDQGANAPSWVPSSAPISDEASAVRNAIGGLATPDVATVDGAPVVCEYGDVQRDDAGRLFSVMKRLYVLAHAGRVTAVTGFKVGDLDLVHVGQVQTDPTLIGYVEGPPPIPSENLTRPFWYDPTKPSYLAYYNSSAVTLDETEGLEVGLAASAQEATANQFGFSAGLALEFKTESIIGVAVQTSIQTSTFSGRLGGGIDFSWANGQAEGSSSSTTLSTGRRHHFYNCGDWERPGPEGEVVLASGERRFIPNNEGMAVVRSLTADLFSMHLRSTGALVSLAVVPNDDIPEDVNLIYFPINPEYVKNGTLDGRLGLQPDPDIGKRSTTELSYFKPTQAYALQRDIEATQARLSAWYDQLDAVGLGKAGATDLTDDRDEDPLWDAERRVPRTDLVTTNVWTAAGGLYTESAGTANAVREHLGGLNDFSRVGKVGLDVAFAIGGPVGAFAEAHFNNQYTRTVTVAKDRSDAVALSLDVAADPDGFLSRYTGGVTPPFEQPAYSADPVPGKVDSYRFKTFYRAPRSDAFDDFFSEVVDPTWLAQSTDPRAAALREAQAGGTGSAWRVLHRVTFVSRIPPEFQVTPVVTTAPLARRPANLEGNQALIALVKRRIPALTGPTAVGIGDAVRAVFDDDLVDALPWWGEFRDLAREPDSEAAAVWQRLRVDTMSWMLAAFETDSVTTR